jgi:hypothetical protein
MVSRIARYIEYCSCDIAILNRPYDGPIPDLDSTRNRLARKELGSIPFSSQLFTIVCFGLTHDPLRVFIFHIRR